MIQHGSDASNQIHALLEQRVTTLAAVRDTLVPAVRNVLSMRDAISSFGSVAEDVRASLGSEVTAEVIVSKFARSANDHHLCMASLQRSQLLSDTYVRFHKAVEGFRFEEAVSCLDSVADIDAEEALCDTFIRRRSLLAEVLLSFTVASVSVKPDAILFDSQAWNNMTGPHGLTAALGALNMVDGVSHAVQDLVLNNVLLPLVTKRSAFTVVFHSTSEVVISKADASTYDAKIVLQHIADLEKFINFHSLNVNLVSCESLIKDVLPESFSELRDVLHSLSEVSLSSDQVLSLWSTARCEHIVWRARDCASQHRPDDFLRHAALFIDCMQGASGETLRKLELALHDAFELVFFLGTDPVDDHSFLMVFRKHMFLIDLIPDLTNYRVSSKSRRMEQALHDCDAFLTTEVFPHLPSIQEEERYRSVKRSLEHWRRSVEDVEVVDHALHQFLEYLFARDAIGAEESEYLQQICSLFFSFPMFDKCPSAAAFREVCNVLMFSMSDVRAAWDAGRLTVIGRDRLCKLVTALFESNAKRETLLQHLLR